MRGRRLDESLVDLQKYVSYYLSLLQTMVDGKQYFCRGGNFKYDDPDAPPGKRAWLCRSRRTRRSSADTGRKAMVCQSEQWILRIEGGIAKR